MASMTREQMNQFMCTNFTDEELAKIEALCKSVSPFTMALWVNDTIFEVSVCIPKGFVDPEPVTSVHKNESLIVALGAALAELDALRDKAANESNAC